MFIKKRLGMYRENQAQKTDEIIQSYVRRPRASHSTEVTISLFLALTVGHLIALK